ncbi:MAG: hypothetical protein HYU25_11755 [Candidatus Rokubacteria bacterium]|nr:hypothetical protein [Candidatus Rokubacteria bacterium]
MSRSRFLGIALLSLAVGGCASLRLPAWVPIFGAKVEKPPVTPKPPLRRPIDAEKPEVLYTAAKAHLAEGRDNEAYRALSQLARVSPQYKDSPALLRDLRPRLVQQHYQQGLLHFREEKVEEAIVEWKVVLEIDPAHENARRNIEQAEQILRTLAEQQKKR